MSFLKRIFNNYMNGHHGGGNNHGGYGGNSHGSRRGHHGNRQDAPYYSNNQVTKNCPYCQATMDSQSQFCGQCGKNASDAACRCGATITPGAKFCGQCGASL